MLSGPRRRQDLERDLPGSLARLDRDAVTFFETDLPALSRWRFDAERARRITSPVLYVGGDASGPLSPRSASSSCAGCPPPRTSSSPARTTTS